MKQFAAIAIAALAAIAVLVFLSRSGPDADEPESRAAGHHSAGMGEHDAGAAGGTSRSTAAGASMGSSAGGGPSAQNLAERIPKRNAAAGGSTEGGSTGTALSATSETRAGGKGTAQGGSDAGTSILASSPLTANGPQNVPVRSDDQQQALQNAGVADAAADVAYASDKGQHFPVNSQVDIPLKDKLTGDAGSVSFWLQPQWQGKGDDAQFVQFGDSSLQVAKNVDFLRFEYLDPNGVERGLGMNIDNWNAGDWHQVTGTWMNGQYTLYVDGKLISQNTFPLGPDLQGDMHLMVGSSLPNNAAAAPGAIDQLTVLNHILSPDDIAQQFKDGSATHR